MFKYVPVILSILLGTATADTPTVKELLGQFVKSRENSTSYIAKINEKTIFTYPAFNGTGTMYKKTEFRSDGYRCKTIVSTWGDINVRYRNVKEEQADYHSTLWDGERAFTVGRSTLMGDGLTRAHIIDQNDPGEEEIKVYGDYKANIFEEANGYHRGDLTRIDNVFLEPSSKVQLRNEKSNLRGVDCYVIEADVPQRGNYIVWIDPVHDFHIARIVVKREKGDIIRRRPLDQNCTSKEFYEVLEFEQVGDVWCPKTCKYKRVRDSEGYHSSSEHEISYTQITLNPDHDALGSFLPDDILNGSQVYLRAFSADISFIWQDGKVIDTDGKIIMDCTKKPEIK